MQYRAVTVLAPAKLNLSLDVVGTLPNGYHDLDMVMQTIDLYEKITLRRSNDLSLTLPGSFVPVNDKNTAVKAARRAAREITRAANDRDLLRIEDKSANDFVTSAARAGAAGGGLAPGDGKAGGQHRVQPEGGHGVVHQLHLHRIL